MFPYSPAGGGLLSGKYADKAAQGRIANVKQYAERYSDAWMHDVALDFAAFCKKHGFHPMSAAVAWVAAHPAVTAPIIGARNVQQLQASLDSLKIEMTPALRAEIAALSRTPPPATDRLEEVGADSYFQSRERPPAPTPVRTQERHAHDGSRRGLARGCVGGTALRIGADGAEGPSAEARLVAGARAEARWRRRSAPSRRRPSSPPLCAMTAP